ncbi:MAG: hypothetical protein EON58_12300, partial [Alphaproteobacteria bacterium]
MTSLSVFARFSRIFLLLWLFCAFPASAADSQLLQSGVWTHDIDRGDTPYIDVPAGTSILQIERANLVTLWGITPVPPANPVTAWRIGSAPVWGRNSSGTVIWTADGIIQISSYVFTPPAVGRYYFVVQESGVGFDTMKYSLRATITTKPAVTSSGSASATAGQAFSYQITASHSPTSYGASGLPSGLGVNPSTGVISGTPSSGGTYVATISAANSAGSGTKTITISVSGPQAPVITSATTATATVGQYFSYQITATNSPSSYGASNLPSGVSVNPATGLITGTSYSTGTRTVTLSATNATGTGSRTLTLTMINPPAPVISSAGTALAKVGQPFAYWITASNGPHTYNTSSLPSGLTIDPSGGSISGIPTATGNYTVTVSATNAGGTGTKAVSITISNPPVPVISSAATAAARVGQPFSYQIIASNAPSSFGTSNLPSNFKINTVTGVISGTPIAVGAHQVPVRATNAGGTGSMTLSIAIADPPPLTEPALAAGQSHSLFLQSDGTAWACGFRYNRTPEVVMTEVKSISAGWNHSLFLRNDGSVWACGSNYRGQLGDGTKIDNNTPIQVMTGVKAIAAGRDHSVFLKTDGSVWGCGENSGNSLSASSSPEILTPMQVVGAGIHKIAAGGFNLFALSDLSGVRLKGHFLQSNSTFGSRDVTFDVPNVTAIAAGSAH